jgi:uncharacterized protein YvpB
MKNDIFGDILRAIFTFWNDPNLEEFIEKGRAFKDLSMVRLGKCQEVDIFLVNGDIVKTRYFEDFVEGGNDAVYGKKSGEIAKFMPDNQVWIDANIDINSLPYICFHELWERYQMSSHGLSYDPAHEKADKLEMKLRKIKTFESRRKLLQFPRVEQPDNSTCGHTSIVMIAQYYGASYKVDDIRQMVSQKENSEGLSPETILKIASQLRFKAKVENGLSFEAIKTYINNDTPVIIELQSLEEPSQNHDWENEWENGHYVVAIGYTLENLIFADPQSFLKSYLSYEELLPRWHDIDYGKKNEKLAIIIERPNNKDFEREKTIPLI